MSTRVDFYILSESDNRDSFVCKIIDKAYRQGHKVFVQTNNLQEAQRIDELLWTFQDNSFIPHNLYGEGPTPPPPIQIGHHSDKHQHNDILLNLATPVPNFYNKYQRVLEIIASDDTGKTTGREHFRFYREQNCNLNTHKL